MPDLSKHEKTLLDAKTSDSILHALGVLCHRTTTSTSPAPTLNTSTLLNWKTSLSSYPADTLHEVATLIHTCFDAIGFNPLDLPKIENPDPERWREKFANQLVDAYSTNFPRDWQTRLAVLNANASHLIHIMLPSNNPDAFSKSLEFYHLLWVVAQRQQRVKHPISPLVKAWIEDYRPPVEPERRNDTGILHNSLRHSAPSPRLKFHTIEHLDAEPEQMMLITNLPQNDLQLQLPGFAFPESELVPALPLEVYENAGGKLKRKGRGAPIEQRLFFNILVEYEMKQRGVHGTSRLLTNYHDVKKWLYPTGTKEPRKTLIPKLYKGMYYLHNLRFVWERREWNIVSVDSLPTMAIKPDDPLTFTVRMPPGMNSKNGALIGIEPMRLYGVQSAPKFRAWIRLAYFWDAAKIRNGGKRIYATVPEVLRNTDGYLVDAKGEVILTGELYPTQAGWKFRQGKEPQKAWYHPLAVRTRKQIRNPQADKVPVLSDSDMVQLFYDHTERKGEAFKKALHDSRQHAMAMQDDGRIIVETNQINEKTPVKGWRLLEPYNPEV